MTTLERVPTVTVIALSFNHAKFVTECLDSIHSQTHPHFELIIMDDCSTDNSVSIIRDWIDHNKVVCKFVVHAVNVGICKTLNEAISLSTGDLICMIATDDRWRPNRVKSHLEIARLQSANIAVIYSDTAQIDESGLPIKNTFLEGQRPGFAPPSGRVFEQLVDRNFVHPLASTIRRSAIVEIGGYDERLATEDYDMWLRLSNRFHFLYSKEIVSDYRIVSTSMTRTLFSNPTPQYSYGLFLLYEKWIPSGLLSSTQRTDWYQKQASAAYWLYFNSDPRASKCLWKAALRTRRPRFFLLAVLSSSGISRAYFTKMALNLTAIGKRTK